MPGTQLSASDLPLEQFLDEGNLTLQISGQCMQPLLANGATIEVGLGPYWPGDLLTVRRADGSLVTHRFLGYGMSRQWRRVALLRADEARRADPLVPLAHILGRVTHIDGVAYRPSAGDRVRAARAWFAAMSQLTLHRWKRRSSACFPPTA